MNNEAANAREAEAMKSNLGKLESPDGFVVGIPLVGKSFAAQRATYWRLAREGAIQLTAYRDPTAAGEHEALLASLDRESSSEEAE